MYAHTNIYTRMSIGALLANNQKAETTQMPFSGYKLQHPYHRILLSKIK